MDWPQLLIALVVIAVYLLKHILSGQQETLVRRDAPRESEPPAPPVLTAEQSDVEMAQRETEMDGRLGEYRKRRKEMEAGRPPSEPPVVVVPRPVPRYEPGAPPAPEARRPPRPEPPRVERKLPRRQDAIPVATPVAPPPADVLLQASVARPAPRAVRKVVELLRDRDTLAAAFLLKEILDRPLSQRRQRS
jgi:hypothetical protein